MGTTTSATARFEQALRLRNCDPDYGAQWGDAYCPACANPERTLHYRQGDDAVVFKCHDGCSKRQILDRLGMTWRDAFDNPLPSVPDIAAVEAEWHDGRLELVETLGEIPDTITQQCAREAAREVALIFGLYRAAGWTGPVMITGDFLQARVARRGVEFTARAYRAALGDLERHGYLSRVEKKNGKWTYTEPGSATPVIAHLLERPEDEDPTSGPVHEDPLCGSGGPVLAWEQSQARIRELRRQRQAIAARSAPSAVGDRLQTAS